MTDTKRDSALQRALESFERKPSPTQQLANELGLTVGAVHQWKRVPVEHVLKVEELTGVSRYELRPDIYGEAP